MSRAAQIVLLLFGALLCAAGGAWAVAQFRPEPVPAPVELDRVYQELAVTRMQIAETRDELIKKIEAKRDVEIRKIYIRAQAQVDELGTRPEDVAHGLVDLAARLRAERSARQTETSSAVRQD